MLRTSTESTGDLDIITRKIVSTGDLVSFVEITNESDGQSFHLHFKVLAEFSWINIIVASAQFRGVVDIDGYVPGEQRLFPVSSRTDSKLSWLLAGFHPSRHAGGQMVG